MTGLEVGAVQGAAALPAAASAVTGAYTTAGQRIGAALEASKYKAWVERLARGAEGFFVPVSPLTPSFAGNMSSLIEQLFKILQNKNENND